MTSESFNSYSPPGGSVTEYYDEPGRPLVVVPEIVGDPDFSYRLLVGHQRTDGSTKTTEQLHTEYIRLTDELVHKMVDGIVVTNPTTGEIEKSPVDYVVWLDKSARPLCWLTRDIWPLLAAGKDGNVPKMPESRFVNIDRKQWTSSIDSEGTGVTDVGKVDESIIRSLRSVFLSDPKDRENGLAEAIDGAPTQLDGKTVLVVDEVLSTGRTLDYATQFFQRAFPSAKVGGAHWMSKMAVRAGALGNADLPVWYSDQTELGRGIGNRNVDLSLKSKSPVNRLGAYFLGNRLIAPDPLSRQLRIELHQLAQDAKAGKVFIEPSPHRDEDDYDERAMRLNHLPSMEKYIQSRRRRTS